MTLNRNAVAAIERRATTLARLLLSDRAHQDERGRYTTSQAHTQERGAAVRELLSALQWARARAYRWAANRLPTTSALLELGTGLAPLTWVHRAGGELGALDVVVQCATSAQRSNIEAQLDGAGIAHRRPTGLPPAEWWDVVSAPGGEFDGQTEPTWDILAAFAQQLAPQLGRAIREFAAIDRLGATLRGRATHYESRAADEESD